MKKLFLIIVLFLGFVSVKAQYKIKSDVVYTVFGNAADTVVKNGSFTYTLFVSPWAEAVKIRPVITRTKGTYSKARIILQTSLDNVNWTAKDTVSVATTAASYSAVSDLITPKDPYVRFIITPYDSTQTLKYKYHILIDK